MIVCAKENSKTNRQTLYSLDRLALYEEVRLGFLLLKFELFQVQLVDAFGYPVDAVMSMTSRKRWDLQKPFAILAVLQGVLQGGLAMHRQLILGDRLAGWHCELVGQATLKAILEGGLR